MSASLSGTVNGMDLISQMEAAQNEQQRLVEEQAAQARAAAQQALSAYSGAAAQPAPELSPADTFIPTLVGNIASTLAQNPVYQQHAHENLQQKHADLLKNRAATLESLQTIAQQKAEQAQKAGDLASTEKFRLEQEKYAKTYQQILEAQKQQGAQDLEKTRQANRLGVVAAQGAQQRQTNAAKGGTQEELDASFDNEVKQTVSGRNYLPSTNFKGKAVDAARIYAAKNKIPFVSPQDDSRLGRLDVARNNVATMKEDMEAFLPKHWNDALQIGNNIAADATGSDPRVRTYRENVAAIIEQFVALAGGQGTGVRINKSEIDRIIKAAPTITTPLPAARAWVERVNRFVDNTEGPILKRAGLQQPTQVSGKIVMINPDDKKRYEVDVGEVKTAVANGWKRAQ